MVLKQTARPVVSQVVQAVGGRAAA